MDENESDFINGETQVIREFAHNEGYGTHTGVNLWALGLKQSSSSARSVDQDKRNVLNSLSLWHMGYDGIFMYSARDLTILNYVVLGKTTGLENGSNNRLTFSGISRGSASKSGDQYVNENNCL